MTIQIITNKKLLLLLDLSWLSTVNQRTKNIYKNFFTKVLTQLTFLSSKSIYIAIYHFVNFPSQNETYSLFQNIRAKLYNPAIKL